jgi:ribosomal protein L7/L12
MIDGLITIEKEYVLEKLYSLVQLCQKTDISADKQLFDGRLISAQQMFNRTEEEYGFNDHFDLSEVMRQANKLWKIMNRIQDGEEVYKVVLDEELEDFIILGQKINAIKRYRTVMKEQLGEQPGLRESKDYVDALQDNLNKLRGYK